MGAFAKEMRWRQSGLGDVRSTAAYDADTQTVFVVSANGRIYKPRASDGAILGQFNAGQTSTLPLLPAVIGDRVFFSVGNPVYAVYDQYWSEYAVWVVSNENLYFRSCDGAIVALTSGTPQAAAAGPAVASAAPPDPPEAFPLVTIPHSEARAWAGHTVTVTGTLRYVFNNGKQVLLGFANPHQGAFKAIIRQADWDRFDSVPEQIYHVGQRVAVTGRVVWYQGDLAIFVAVPEQIRVPNPKEVRHARRTLNLSEHPPGLAGGVAGPAAPGRYRPCPGSGPPTVPTTGR